MTPIPGWPGYHATDDGRIFSTHRRVHVSGFTWVPYLDGPPRELAQFDRKSVRKKATPYKSVCFKRDGKARNLYVHELIALTFIGPRPVGLEILHGKEGSTVNRASNLRYGTAEENSKERNLSRGDAWYRARGMRPPWVDAPIVAPIVDPNAHAFSGLLNGGSNG